MALTSAARIPSLSLLSNNKLDLYGSLYEPVQTPSFTGLRTADVPGAASNDLTVKPNTNGALGKYQTSLQVINAVSTGIEAGQIVASSFANARALRAKARTNMQQADLNYETYRRQSEYIAEENLSKVSLILHEGRVMEGEQMAAMGASGFDVSAGDQRIIADTRFKTAKDVDALNRTAYLESFEMWRSTMLENTRLKAEADMLKVEAKYVKRAGIAGGISRIASGILGSFQLGSSGKNIKNIDVGGRVM